MKYISIQKYYKRAIKLATFLAITTCSQNLSALQVRPMIFDMAAAGAEARKTITVVNTSANPTPVELIINRMDLDFNGKVLQLPGGEDDLLIFPPQTVIPPNASQTFRIQWIGDPDLAESQSYNILISQLPITTESISGEVNFSVSLAYEFLTTVTVAPTNGEWSFTVRNVEVTTTDEGKPAVALTVENTGNKHNYLSNAKVVLESDEWNKTLPPTLVRALIGIGLVLPKHTRRILMPMEELPKKVKNLTATVTFGK